MLEKWRLVLEGGKGDHLRKGAEVWVVKALQSGWSGGILICLVQRSGLCLVGCMGCQANVGCPPVVALCHIVIRIARGSQPHQVPQVGEVWQ